MVANSGGNEVVKLTSLYRQIHAFQFVRIQDGTSYSDEEAAGCASDAQSHLLH